MRVPMTKNTDHNGVRSPNRFSTPSRPERFAAIRRNTDERLWPGTKRRNWLRHSSRAALFVISLYGQIDPLLGGDQRFDQFLDQRLAAGDIGSA